MEAKKLEQPREQTDEAAEALETTLADIAADARRKADHYADETEVPEGGE